MFYTVAEMTLELEYQKKDVEINMPQWYRSGAVNKREDEFSRITITLIDEKTLNVKFEQMDFFGIDKGSWNEKDHPERERILKEIIEQIETATKIKTIIKEIKRECY